MTLHFKNSFLLFMAMLCAPFSYGNIVVSYFELTQVEKTVHLRWEVREGSICNGIQIYRSTDSVNFSFIGSIEGVCGSPAFAQRFSFVDINPEINKRNYYKLEFGLNEFSIVRAIHHAYVENGFFTVENPVSSSSKLTFSQAYGRLILRLYTNNGHLLVQEFIENTDYPLSYFLPNYTHNVILIEVSDTKGNSQRKKLIYIP